MEFPTHRRFVLNRKEDESGISGTGIVAQGILWGNGWVSITWLSSRPATGHYRSMDDVDWVHGHNGKTEIVFIDDDDK